jgi:hypothetical protein
MRSPLANPIVRAVIWLTAAPIASVYLGSLIGWSLFHLFGGFRGEGMDVPIFSWIGLGIGAIAGVAGVFASLFCALASLRGTIDDDGALRVGCASITGSSQTGER